MYSRDNTTDKLFPDYGPYDYNDSQCYVNGTLSSELCLEHEVPMFRHSLSVTVLYCVSYILVSLMGVIGNSFVVAVVIRSPRMRTVTNVFIANLAVADLLVNIIVLPTTLIGHLFSGKLVKSDYCCLERERERTFEGFCSRSVIMFPPDSVLSPQRPVKPLGLSVFSTQIIFQQ